MRVLNTDISICTETWLSSRNHPNAYQIHGYNCHHADRNSDSGHGGVAVWTKNSFQSSTVPFTSFPFLEICAIDIFSLKLVVTGDYLPPGIAAPLFRSFCDTLFHGSRLGAE